MSDLPQELESEFETFDRLTVEAKYSDQRKQIVRGIEARVRDGSRILTDAQFRDSLGDERHLARILAYLLVEHGRVKSSVEDWRSNVAREWEALQWRKFAEGSSAMPLYYAVRSYLTNLKQSADAVPKGRTDLSLLEQIETTLPGVGLDPGGQVRGAIQQIRTIVEQDPAFAPNPVIGAAIISRRGAIVAAVVAAVAAVTAAILANWDKLARGPSGQTSTPRTSAPKDSAASPARR